MAEQKQLNFVRLIKKHSIVLNKSQLPDVKKQKGAALQALALECESELGLKIQPTNLIKKIHNLKRDVKLKADKNRTGTRMCILILCCAMYSEQSFSVYSV